MVDGHTLAGLGDGFFFFTYFGRCLDRYAGLFFQSRSNKFFVNGVGLRSFNAIGVANIFGFGQGLGDVHILGVTYKGLRVTMFGYYMKGAMTGQRGGLFFNHIVVSMTSVGTFFVF